MRVSLELEVKEMSKWILIEVENQNLVEEGDEASIDEYDANIQTDSYNIDWKIYEVETE